MRWIFKNYGIITNIFEWLHNYNIDGIFIKLFAIIIRNEQIQFGILWL